MRIALLGGSFNPPHMGHQMVCLYLLEAEQFDRVWLVPCYRHAFSKPLETFERRLKMCRLCAEPFAGRVEVSGIEKQLADGGVNRTIDTLHSLDSQYPKKEFTLVIGSDILAEAPSWKGFDEIRARYPVLVLRRAGHEIESREEGLRYSKTVFIEMSSTGIRDRLGRGESVAGLVPSSVLEYIEDEGLYRDG